ncbi:putative glutathione S-transferase [Capsicum annuum]|nr:putative glutathione S-transferase [Capsicum annuum]
MFIDETFKGPSILPKDPYDRALAHFWAKFLEDKSTVAIDILLRVGEEQEKAKEEVYEMLKVLDNELKDKKFFVAENFGFAFDGTLARNFPTSLWSEKFPNFCAWRDEYVNCSQVKEYLPPRKEDELLVYFQLAPARIEAAASAKK